jgi:hypothetical protein
MCHSELNLTLFVVWLLEASEISVPFKNEAIYFQINYFCYQ